MKEEFGNQSAIECDQIDQKTILGKRIQNEDEGEDGKSEIEGDTGSNEGMEQSSKYQYIMQVNAYGILRTYNKDFLINSKEMFLGRLTKEFNQDTTINYIRFSKCSKISRKAARLYFDESTEEFKLQNLSKNAMMVDRAPLMPKQEKILHHKSLILIGDTLFFFLLPQESLEKKKKWLKERRKIILEEANILNPPKNSFDIQSAKRSKFGMPPDDFNPDQLPSVMQSQKKLKHGIGKRMNLKEIETMGQLGLSQLPPGTKAPQAQPQTIKKLI
ncbi:forkhead box s1 [Stylonychia lemnae]|uniref:Forkhead box s1 n=1 Tax=Stylonychia lemnae TaxID=5949 RepID=A0A077ZMI2_STYLE|nr:forkhead box s1 [Stylonychia lemnae]|eukprot:CDW71182.1 forkhead box s1 [Stylonychia lemnae]